jgi:hypothetical protein
MQPTQRIFRAGAPGLKAELRDIVPPENDFGPKFDFRAFHDQVLNGGALPLDILDDRISAWIDRTRGPVTSH